MDPASFSFAVVGMFLTCCKGYRILSDAHRAPRDAQDAARQIRMEGAMLESWGEYWEIRQDQPEHQRQEKLKFYLVNNRTQKGVFEALCAISETFTNLKGLDKKYGLIFQYSGKNDRVNLCCWKLSSTSKAHVVQEPRTPREIEDLLKGRDHGPKPVITGAAKANEETNKTLGYYKVKMSLLDRCRWSIRDKGRIEDLTTELRRYDDDLCRLCHWDALAQMNRAMPALILSQVNNFMGLHLTADIAEKSAKDTTSPVAEGRKRIAEVARFKAKVMTPSTVSNRYRTRWRLFDQREYSVLSNSNPWSLGICLKSQEPILVEWQSYRDEDDRPSQVAEDQIHQLGDFVSVSNRPYDLRGLECMGLFKDAANDRYGMVFNLPKRLRGLSQKTRTEGRRIYNPSTLTDMIHNVDGIVDLGIRFDLAKKLLQSVVILHTSGWLHKNLHPGNVLFFAARPAAGEKIEANKKDFGRPVIVGYGLSRPDDVDDPQRLNVTMNPYSRPQRIGSGIRATPKIYRHPDKTMQPGRRFRHSYDIYCLGLVLLEVGLWRDLREFEDRIALQDPYKFRTFVLEQLVPDLWGKCGVIYGEVVRECLTMSTEDSALTEATQRRLAVRLANKLDQCGA
ncbi:MAG: hypothetical protein L6R40_003477 [Gallowayella cf. fulva]|nr:MAG: hypothetical protein L6R40_003477 [Xanthomendoza cf. fulva]